MSVKRRKLQKHSRSIEELPVEVVGSILELLDFSSVLNFSACCRYFRFVTTNFLRNVNLFRLVVSRDILQLLKDASHCILVLNLSHAPSLTAADLLESFSTMINLTTLDISNTGLTIPSFVRISQNLAKLQNLTMDLLYSKVRKRRQKNFKNNIFNQYKAAFSKLKFIHFHAQDWVLHDRFWEKSLSIVEDATELFELHLTLYHKNYKFLNIIPMKIGSAPKLPFKKLTITTVTVSQDVFYFIDDFKSQYYFGSKFFEELISKKWQFVLFRASEKIFDKVTMSQSLFENLKEHCEYEENKVTVDYNDFGELFCDQCVLHMWHPSLFESNCHLSQEIVADIEKKIPKEIHGNSASVMSLHLTINEDEWERAEQKICAGVSAKQLAIAETITPHVNFNILENITVFILADIESARDDFFYHLFLQCPNLETLILRCASKEKIHQMACMSINLAKNLKTIQLSGYFLDFKQWLTQLINCIKIENVEFRCATNSIAGPQALICRADLFKFINKSKYLNTLLVCFQFRNLQDSEVLKKKIKALNESFQCAIEKYKRQYFYYAIIGLGWSADVDAHCEDFYPIYSKFLKPLHNLKVK